MLQNGCHFGKLTYRVLRLQVSPEEWIMFYFFSVFCFRVTLARQNCWHLFNKAFELTLKKKLLVAKTPVRIFGHFVNVEI